MEIETSLFAWKLCKPFYIANSKTFREQTGPRIRRKGEFGIRGVSGGGLIFLEALKLRVSCVKYQQATATNQQTLSNLHKQIYNMSRLKVSFLYRPINKLILSLLLIASALVLLLQQSTLRLSAMAPLQLTLSNSSGMTLVLNGHSGTALDWNRLVSSEILNLTSYSELSPRLFTPYGQSRAEATFLGKTIGISAS